MSGINPWDISVSTGIPMPSLGQIRKQVQTARVHFQRLTNSIARYSFIDQKYKQFSLTRQKRKVQLKSLRAYHQKHKKQMTIHRKKAQVDQQILKNNIFIAKQNHQIIKIKNKVSIQQINLNTYLQQKNIQQQNKFEKLIKLHNSKTTTHQRLHSKKYKMKNEFKSIGKTSPNKEVAQQKPLWQIIQQNNF